MFAIQEKRATRQGVARGFGKTQSNNKCDDEEEEGKGSCPIEC